MTHSKGHYLSCRTKAGKIIFTLFFFFFVIMLLLGILLLKQKHYASTEQLKCNEKGSQSPEELSA